MSALAIPAIEALHSIEAWFGASWHEFIAFSQSLVQHPPTLRAAILAGVILVCLWIALSLVLLAMRWLRSRGEGAKQFRVVLEGGRDRIARVTKDADLPAIRGAKIVIIVAIQNGKRRSVTAKLERRNRSKNFTDDSIALTQSVMDQLDLSRTRAEKVTRKATARSCSLAGSLGTARADCLIGPSSMRTRTPA